MILKLNFFIKLKFELFFKSSNANYRKRLYCVPCVVIQEGDGTFNQIPMMKSNLIWYFQQVYKISRNLWNILSQIMIYFKKKVLIYLFNNYLQWFMGWVLKLFGIWCSRLLNEMASWYKLSRFLYRSTSSWSNHG